MKLATFLPPLSYRARLKQGCSSMFYAWDMMEKIRPMWLRGFFAGAIGWFWYEGERIRAPVRYVRSYSERAAAAV